VTAVTVIVTVRDMAETVVLISHPCRQWPGAYDLKVASDGWLLCISRDPLRDAAKRLIEEGYDPASALIIRDSYDAVPELRSTIKEAARA
jgi:hypothetical protein